MLFNLFIRYIHFIGIITLTGTLVAEWVLLKPQLSRAELRRLSIIDGLYGLSSLVVVGAGLTMWLAGGKPADFYNGNGIFYLKLGLVTVTGLLSAYPTVFFIRESRRGEPTDILEVPSLIRQFIRLELVLLLLIPMLAVLMASGIRLP